MRKKLSSKIVEHLQTLGPKRMDVWDTVLQGFGTRVSPTGRKVWFVVVRTDGRLRRVTIGTYPAISLAEAREEARKIMSKAQLGVLDEPAREAKQSLGELVPLFIQLYARPKNRDWKETEHVLRKFDSLFAKDINAIRRPDVVRVLDGIVSSGTPYRANRALAALKKLMNWALDRGIIEINPIAGLKPPHKEQARDRVLSDVELTILLHVADAEGYPF